MAVATAVAVVLIVAATVGLVLGIAFVVPAWRPWSKSAAQSLLNRTGPDSGETIADSGTPAAQSVDGVLLSPTVGSQQIAASGLDDFAASLTAVKRFSRRTVLPPAELSTDDAIALSTEAAAAFATLCATQRIWRVQARGRVTTTTQHKRNAGAAHLIRRDIVRLARSRPRALSGTCEFPTIRSGRESLYFTSIGLLRQCGRRFELLAYDSIETEGGRTRMIEDGRQPRDATQVDTTWQYVNVKGGPDRRYKNNRRLPVMRYGQLVLAARNGLQWNLQVSREGASEDFARFLRHAAETPRPRIQQPVSEPIAIPSARTSVEDEQTLRFGRSTVCLRFDGLEIQKVGQPATFVPFADLVEIHARPPRGRESGFVQFVCRTDSAPKAATHRGATGPTTVRFGVADETWVMDFVEQMNEQIVRGATV
jgi:hypothetical protein